MASDLLFYEETHLFFNVANLLKYLKICEGVSHLSLENTLVPSAVRMDLIHAATALSSFNPFAPHGA